MLNALKASGALLLVSTLLANSGPAGAPPAAEPVVPYDVVYVRAPRYGDTNHVTLPEVKNPIQMPPGADLMLLHPDGSEEVLVAGGNGSIVDPVVSFDAEWVFYSRFHDMRKEALNEQ